MITVHLLESTGNLQVGGLELIERWRQEQDSIIWVDLEGEDDLQQRAMLKDFGCHELAIKDALRDRHPPKIELFDNQLFILFRGISAANDFLDIEHLQIALFVGERYLLSRHQLPSFSIGRWMQSPELAQMMQYPTVLMMRIMHTSGGRYLELLLDFEERLSEIEDVLALGPSDEVLKELTTYKTRLMKLKRIFDYHVDIAREFPVETFTKTHDVAHYQQDLFERCERLYSLTAMYYEICGDLVEGSLSLFSHQMNITMRVLTVITAIFVPLSFIAGLYGMNFEYIPELKYQSGYFYVVGFMATVAVGLAALFKWKKWL